MKVSKPNFFIIGSPKSATSSLCYILGHHPDVFMCTPKEPHFFSQYYEKGFKWYESYFEKAAGDKAIGEGSVSYSNTLRFPLTADRIANYMPTARLIYMVRHPLRRIESHWRMMKDESPSIIPPFDEALRTEGSLIEQSRYWTHLCHYHQHFREDQILVIFFEDFATNPRETVRLCLEHLGVDPCFRLPDVAFTPRNAAEERKLERYFVERLSTLSIATPLWHLIPQKMRKVVRNRLRRQSAPAPIWTKESREFVIARIEHDITSLLAYCKRPIDLWNLQS